MKNKWHGWLPSSQSLPEEGHSIKEVEHRFTDLEAFTKESRHDRAELHEIVQYHGEKLQTHERAILALVIAFSALMQEQFPRIAALLRSALP